MKWLKNQWWIKFYKQEKILYNKDKNKYSDPAVQAKKK